MGVNILLAIALAIVGAIFASFVGVIAERAYTGQSWRKGRSRCNSCRRTLTARDLLPVFSWLIHKGRCRTCGARVPGLYVIAELTLGFLFALAYAVFGISTALFVFLAALLVLAFIVLYDLRHTLIPPEASSLLIALCALFAYLQAPNFTIFMELLLISAGIALFFFALYFFSRGRAMGLGDTPVAFALSLLAGTQAIAGLLFSFWIGGVIGILILAFRKGGPTMGIEVPFVPFMAAGFLLALFSQWNPLPPLF